MKQTVVEVAFRLHDEGRITHEELEQLLEQCANAVAIDNGYGLPFPERPSALPFPDRPSRKHG